MHRYLLIVLFTALFFQGISQNETDLFRYSKTTYHGTARFEAMGGSFGALGADLSSSQINPACYGRYSSSQTGISFYGGQISNESNFANTVTHSKSAQGGLSNLAVVLTEDISESSTGFLFTQIGFGYNRIESFRNTFHYKGQQFESLLDNFVGQAQGYYPDELGDYFPFSTNLAYLTHSIEYDFASNQYYSLLNNGDMLHERVVEQKGGINEFFFSLSTNYLNKLYLGANIGLRTYRYLENYLHTETLTDTSNTPLRSFNYEYDLKTIGSGVNLKIGAIYLASEQLRFGLSLHSPTFSQLTDKWHATMSSIFSDSSVSIPESQIPYGDYKYRIRNPFKVVGSIALVFGTKGCFNLDVEYLNYKQAHFRSTNDESYQAYNYDYENTIADMVFQDAVNVRAGIEYVLFSSFFLRTGLAYYGNAFRSEEKSETAVDLSYTGGFGIKKGKFSYDIAYRHRMFKRNYYAFYNSSAEVSSQIGQITLSCLFNF